MKHHDFRPDRAALTGTAPRADVTCLIVPGLDGSGPGHWQTLWEHSRDDCRRAELGDWSDPHVDAWQRGLDAAVTAAAGPVVLVAHSLGCFAVAWWAQSADPSLVAKVRGALLVAPPDVEGADVDGRLRRFAPTPRLAPRFPAILVASEDDPYASPARSREIAAAWCAEFVNLGAVGHINAASRLGYWPAGQALLESLLHRARTGVTAR